MVTTNGSLSGAKLSPEDLAELVDTQLYCVLSFVDPQGWPRGVVVSYLPHDGRYWFTAIAGRRHVEGPRADPRVSMVIDNRGTALTGRRMVSQRGRAILHQDRSTVEWFYPAFARRHEPADPEPYATHLDVPDRVVVEIVPVGRPTTYDSRRLTNDPRATDPRLTTS
jgi:hypothetical protein